MFQYAAGLALAHRRNTILKLDVSWFSERSAEVAHEKYWLDCFVLDAHFATEQELAWCRGHQRNVAESRFGRLLAKIGLRRYSELLPNGGNWHIQKQFHFYPEFFDLPDGTVIDGTFQSENFFGPVAKIIRKHFGFRYKPSRAVAALAEQIESCEAVAIHFRRGDLLTSAKSTADPLAMTINLFDGIASVARKAKAKVPLTSGRTMHAGNGGALSEKCLLTYEKRHHLGWLASTPRSAARVCQIAASGLGGNVLRTPKRPI